MEKSIPAEKLSAVGSTAVGVAVALATENDRPDALFHDPLPGEFVRAVGESQALWSSPDSEVLRRVMGDYLALRTRFFDDLLIAAAGEGCTQVVVVAAGLDTRAFRLPWPAGTVLFEVDRADVLEVKQSVITDRGATPTCDRRVVTADLREDWATALLGSGFDPARPTAWLVEGLIGYLSAAEADSLFTEIGRLSAPGSRLGLEHVTRQMLETDATRSEIARGGDGGLQLLSSLWRNESTATPQEWVAGHGWEPRTQDLVELAAQHRRPVPLAFDARLPGTATALLMSGQRIV